MENVLFLLFFLNVLRYVYLGQIDVKDEYNCTQRTIVLEKKSSAGVENRRVVQKSTFIFVENVEKKIKTARIKKK